MVGKIDAKCEKESYWTLDRSWRNSTKLGERKLWMGDKMDAKCEKETYWTLDIGKILQNIVL